MSEVHIVIRLDRDDYRFLQPGYARLHLTPSQIIRLAIDRFLTEPSYRPHQPFAVPRPVVNEDLEDQPEVGATEAPTTLSVRVDRTRRDMLRTLLRPPRFGLGAFCRGALVAPGQVLESPYVDERMLILCAERDFYFWPEPPMHEMPIDLDTQPDLSHRRGQGRRRR